MKATDKTNNNDKIFMMLQLQDCRVKNTNSYKTLMPIVP